jgi:hypothetical protein
MLKAVKHLSMNQTLLDVLQNANAIEILTKILEEQSSGSHSTVSFSTIFCPRIANCAKTGDVKSNIPDML